MKLLFVLILVVLSDRAIPAAAWRYGAPYAGITEDTFFKRYGLVAFPRTMFAVCACLIAGLDIVLTIDVTIQGIAVLVLLFIYYVVASIDVWRAMNNRGRVRRDTGKE